MNHEAKISLITTQDSQKFEFLCEGVIYSKNDTTFIEFENENEKASIGVSDELVTLNRIGVENSYTMILEKGKKHRMGVLQGLDLGLSACADKIMTKTSLINNMNIFELFVSYTLSAYSGDVKMKLRVKCEYLCTKNN